RVRREVHALAAEGALHGLALEPDGGLLGEETLRLEVEEDLVQERAEARRVVGALRGHIERLLRGERLDPGDDVRERDRGRLEQALDGRGLALEAEVRGVVE